MRSVLIGVGLIIGVIACLLNAYVRYYTPRRHARYALRVRLARWFYEGRLRDVRLSDIKNGKIRAIK